MDFLKFLEKLGKIYPNFFRTTKENESLEKINGQIADTLGIIARDLLSSPYTVENISHQSLMHIFLDQRGARCKELEEAVYVLSLPSHASNLIKIFDLAYKKEKILTEHVDVVQINKVSKRKKRI
ncbi:MAG: hypothetical protein AB1466_05355 [Actinomycetota bacterium]